MNNVTANNAFEYWKRALFLPYLDHLIMEFESRFNHSSETSRQTLCVLPSNLHLLTDESINLIEDFFKDDLPSKVSLRNELRLWKREWVMVKDKNDLPNTIENTIQKMNVIFYPNISVILRLLLIRQRQLKGAIRHSNLLKQNNVQLLETNVLTLLFCCTFIKIVC